MCSINFVVAETAGNTKVFAWNFCLVKLVSRKNRTLRTKDKTTSKFAVERIIPSAATRVTTVFVNAGNVAQIWFFNRFCVCRIFDAIYVMNIASRMELRHEQSVSVPEFSFYKRTVKFLETKGTKLVLYRFKELYVRVCATRNNACWLQRNIVSAECTVFPVASCKHFWSNFSKFLTCDTSFA